MAVLGVFGILGTGRCVAILNNSLGVHWQRLLEEGWEIAGGTASMQHIPFQSDGNLFEGRTEIFGLKNFRTKNFQTDSECQA